jgi:hypothetical protein
MCEGGRLLADFVAGTCERPEVPKAARAGLTQTVDGEWVVWAHKIAHRQGATFMPMSHGVPYPADAAARCARGGRHQAPDPRCTCGFHALSSRWPGKLVGGRGVAQLEVVLSGRVLALRWAMGGLLYRAERQTVVRIHDPEPELYLPPDDPDGRLAPVRISQPRGGGPVRLRLPTAPPPVVELNDDAGYCRIAPPSSATPDPRVLASV